MRASDLEHVPFYSTLFEVEATDGSDALWGLIQCIRGWMCGKWEGVPRDIERWSRFKVGARAELDTGSVVFESACVRRENGSLSWACTIRETFREAGMAPREWRSQICFDSSEGLARGRVAVAISYADYSGFLGPVQSAPAPSVPGIVRRVVECDWLAATTSGVPASLDAIELHEGDFAAFWQFVSDAGRATPAVYVSPKFEDGEAQLALDPARLASVLGTSARVYYSTDQAFCVEMAASLSDLGLRCEGGTLRVYVARPHFDRAGDSLRHRYFTYAQARELGEDELTAMLRRALAQRPVRIDEPMGVAEIRAELRNLRVTREARSIASAGREDAARRVEEMLDEAIRLEEQNQQLAEQLAHSWTTGGAAEHEPCNVPELGRWPLSPEEIGQLMVTLYPERIDFTERGWKTLRKECKAGPELVWNALRDLACVARGLYVGGACDIEREFRASANFDFAPNAGMMTRKDPGLMAQYQDVYQGRSLNCEAHIGRGNGRSKDRGDIRVYFAFDRASGKIVVSSCGPHLDNYSTRKIH